MTVFKGHLYIQEKVSLHDRCPFIAGSLTWVERTPFWWCPLITWCPLIRASLEDGGLLYYVSQIACKPVELCHNNVIFPVLQSVFSVVDPHPDIYLVARIEKVLQGGVNANTEPYVRNPDVKVGSKIHRAMRLYCHKLGHYRMPFAWAVKLVYTVYIFISYTQSTYNYKYIN